MGKHHYNTKNGEYFFPATMIKLTQVRLIVEGCWVQFPNLKIQFLSIHVFLET